jgi:hypothetical protein
MKSFLKFPLILLTALLVLAYTIGISEKIQNQNFKNLRWSNYIWFGFLLLLIIYLNVKWFFLDRRKENRESNTSTSHAQLSPKKQTIKQYDVFLLAKDLNPVITKGMQGVILEMWDDNSFEIEFVKEDGTNHEYNGEAMFTVDKSFIGEIIWTTSK